MILPKQVIYNPSNYDGRLCEAIARRYLPDDTVFFKWAPGASTPEIDCGESLFMLDTVVPDLMDYENLVWIAHEKDELAGHDPAIPGYRIEAVASCRLLWQYFHNHAPALRDYIDRKVSEPEAVRLIGEYHVADYRDENSLLLNRGLVSCNGKNKEFLLRSVLHEPDELVQRDIAQSSLDWLIDRGYVVTEYLKNSSIAQNTP